jgi:hypothetical protein
MSALAAKLAKSAVPTVVSGPLTPAPRPVAPAARLSLSDVARSGAVSVTTKLVAARFVASSSADIESKTTNGAIKSGSNSVVVNLPKLAKGVRYTFSPFGFSYQAGATLGYSLINAKGVSQAITANTPVTVAADGTYQLKIQSSASLSGSLSLNIYGTAYLPDSCGDANVDCVLYGERGFWQDIQKLRAGIGPSATGAEIKSGLKSIAAGGARGTITYGFLATDPTESLGFEVLNADAKSAIRTAFSYFSNIVNVKFKETTQANADIAFGANDQGGLSNGYAYRPNGSPTPGKTYVMLAKEGTYSSEANFSPGSYNWSTIIHETGHALGLKHPGNYNAGGGGGPGGPYLGESLDTQQYSMMSYVPHAQNQAVYYSSPMLYDIAALQYLYGAKPAGSTASNGVFTFNPNTQPWFVKTLYSKKATDKIDLSALSNASTINLNAGTFSSVNISPTATQYRSNNNNVAIAYGSTINNVKLSNSAAEEVILNTAYQASKYNSIEQLGANDRLTLLPSIFGELAASNVLIGAKVTKATTADTRILVDTAKGDIYFDRDGVGTRYRAVRIAKYTSAGQVTASNFKFSA